MGSALEKEIDQLRGVLWSERDPQGRVFVPLADAYRRMGDLPLARSMIEEGLERLPDFASAHVVAGWIHQDLVSPVEAEESFRRVLELDPENTIALEAMGGLAGARGSHAEAAEYLRRLSALDPRAAGEGAGEDEGTNGVAATSEAPESDDESGVPRSEDEADEAVAPVVGALGKAAAVASAGILLDDADGEDDSHFEELAFEADPSSDEEVAQLSVENLAPENDDATVEISVADLGPDADETVEIAVTDLAPEDEEVPAGIAVGDLAPDEDEVSSAALVADLAPDDVGVEEAEDQNRPDPLAAVPVGELAPDLEAAPDVVEAAPEAAIGIGDLAPSEDEADAAVDTRVSISDLAPDDSAVDEVAASDRGAPDEDVPFDFAVAELTGEAEAGAGLAAVDSEEDADSWVEPVGEFLAQEAVRDEAEIDEGLSVSSVFRSLLGYEPLPASEEVDDGDAEPVADWNWSPVEVDEAPGEGSVKADSADVADEAPEAEGTSEDADGPGPDDFQAWLERNSL